MKWYFTTLIFTVSVALACSQGGDDQSKSRLQTVQDRGQVVCATLDDTPGFGFLDEGGNLVGFDIDLCRAVAAATVSETPTPSSSERSTQPSAGLSCKRAKWTCSCG